MADKQKIKAVMQQHESRLFSKANVRGMGIGFKEAAGQRSDQLALMILVQNKVPTSALSAQDVVPKEIDGVLTDVVQVGKVVALQSPTDKFRPAPGGVSCGHYSITAGTLGAIVKDATSGEYLILSNNHVLANSNDAEIGDAILQPGPLDGGKLGRDELATLERFVRIKYKDEESGTCSLGQAILSFLNSAAKLWGSGTRFQSIAADSINLVDAAVAKPLSQDLVVPEIRGIGPVEGTLEPQVGMKVKKSGRTTDFTTGTITMVDTTIEVGYGGGRVAKFEHQLLTTDMSDPGDSGSLIQSEDNMAVGLLFAGSDTVTVMSPIATVLQQLNITF
jgi:hypothetical protein